MLLDTPRTELLGALLRCDAAAYQVRAARARGRVRAEAVELVHAVRDLLAAAEMIDTAAPEHSRAAGYGLPAWLCSDRRHGAHAAFDLVAVNDWPAPDAYEDGPALLLEADLELMLQVIYRLDDLGQSPLRLLRGRIGDVGQGYVDLAAAVLGERPAVLAASTTPADRPVGLAARLAEHGPRISADEPIARELLARLLRVDFPAIHHRSGLAVVLGLDVELSPVDDLRVPGRRREVRASSTVSGELSKLFRSGVDAGHREAIRLLESVRVPESLIAPVRSLRFRCLEQSDELDGDSAALPVALHVISRSLDLPRPVWVATGAIDEDGSLVVLADEAARVKAGAVQAEGLWQGLVGRFSPMSGPGTLALTGATLGEACAQLWPREWPEVLDRCASRQLEELGCTVEVGFQADPLALRDAEGGVVGIISVEHRLALDHLRRYPTTPVVLGGPTSVGKSWTARSVAAELEREGWSVLVLRFQGGRLPFAAVAAQCAEIALRRYANVDRTRSLLVLEDLAPQPDATDLESVLLHVVNTCECPVLAVALAEHGRESRWKQDAVQVVLHATDNQSLARLAESLVAAHPERFGAAAGREGLLAAAARGDRWWLVRLLDSAGRVGANVISSRELYLGERIGDLDENGWHAAELLAACSTIGRWMPAGALRPLDATALRRLGAWRRVEGPDALWLLPSPVARNSILRRRAGSLDQILHEPLNEVLGSLLDTADLPAVVRFLQDVGNVHDGKVLATLTGRRQTWLVQRLVQQGDSLSLATALQLLRALRESDQASLTDQLLNLLSHDGWPRGRVADLVTCLRALHEHDHLVLSEKTSARELDDRWELLLAGLSSALSPLVRSMRPEEALGLLKVLDRLRRPQWTRPLLTTLCIHGLDMADAGRNADVEVAIAMTDIVRRLSRRDDREPGRRTPFEELVGSTGYKRLSGTTNRALSASDYLARSVLRAQGEAVTGESSSPTVKVERDLENLLPRTSLASLSQTLSVLHKHRAEVLGLLGRVQLGQTLSGRLAVEAPLAVAQFLKALMRVQPRSAQQLLYGTDGRPNANLVDSFAVRMRRTGDRRVLSIALQACGAVDEEFVHGSEGFAELLLDRVRPMCDALTGERPLIVLNVARYMLNVDVERRHVRALRSQFVTYILEAVGRESTAGYDAELALTLAADDVMEGAILGDLRAALDDQRIRRSVLLTKMKRADSPGALAHYHRFALALDPMLATEYRDARPAVATLMGGLRDRRLPAVLDAVQAVGRTLAYAGEESAVGEMLVTLERDAAGWARRLLAVRYPGDVARAIRVLAQLDAPLARAALRAASSAHAGELGTLMNLLTARAEPHEAVEILDAIRAVDHQLAQNLTEQLARTPRWNRRKRFLLSLDHPASLGRALQLLGRLGLVLDARDVRRVESEWSELAGVMASPWTVGNLLAGLTAADQATGERFAARLDSRRLRSRLARVRATDGNGIAVLLTALTDSGSTDVAQALVGQLAARSLTALTPGHATEIARAALAADCAAGPQLGERLRDDILLPALTRRLVQDPDQHLLDIGWLARSTTLLGATPPQTRWESMTGLEHRWARLWAETWLAQTAQRKAEVDTLLDDIGGAASLAKPWQMAAVAVAAARADRLAEVIAQGVNLDVAESSELPWLREVRDALARRPGPA